MIKTRSQLSLPAFDYDVIGRSPLKEARSARRTTHASHLAETHGAEGVQEEEEADEKDPKHPKRSVPKDSNASQERVVKKAKRLLWQAEEDEETVRASSAPTDDTAASFKSESHSSKKPLSTVSLPSDSSSKSSHETEPRSRSVPPDRPIPVVEFHRVPGSPTKMVIKSWSSSRSLSPARSHASQEQLDEPDGHTVELPTTIITTDDDVVMLPSSPETPQATVPKLYASTTPPLELQWPSSDLILPSSPLSPVPPTPGPVRSNVPSSPLLVRGSDVGPLVAPPMKTPLRPRTPATASRIPRPVPSQAVVPSTPLFPHTTPVSSRRGIVSRMKPRGAKISLESSATPRAKTPTAGLSRARTPKAEVAQDGDVDMSEDSRATTPRARTATPVADDIISAFLSTARPKTPSTPKAQPVPMEPEHDDVTSAEPSIPSSTTKGKSKLFKTSVDLVIPLNDAMDETEDTREDENTPKAGSSVIAEPGPSLSSAILEPPSMTASVVSTKAKAPASATEKAKKSISSVRPKTEIPLGGRMTRSASLRQQKITDMIDATTGVKAVNGSAAPQTQGPSVATPSSDPTTPGRKRAHTTSSLTRPTLSSAAKTNAQTPKKPRPPTSAVATSRASSRMSTSSDESTSRPATAMSTTQPSTAISRSSGQTDLARPPHSSAALPSVYTTSGRSEARSTSLSSLANLSIALQKLNALSASRPPSEAGFNRPNTSLGFNDKKAGSDEEDAAPKISGKGKGKAKAKDDSQVGTSSKKAGGSSTTRSAVLRASTVEPSSMAGTKVSHLMLPPPVPKSKASDATSATESEGGKKKINVQSGMISGRGRGGFVFGNAAGKPRFGVGAGRGGHVVHKASKRSTLPSIEGSPVKPAAAGGVNEDEDEKMSGVEEGNVAGSSKDKGKGRMELAPLPAPEFEALRAMVREEIALEDAAAPKETKVGWTPSSSRVSTITKLLSQSVSALPETPPRKTPATEGKGKARASSGSFPQSSLQNTAPGALGRGGGIGARVSAGTRGMSAALAAADGATGSPNTSVEDESATESTPQDSSTKKKHVKSLDILTGCKVFVDVRNEFNADSSDVFQQMLRDLGAKVLGRVGSTCTHIVYKNGLASTLSRYRALGDSKPTVVGVSWVVECAEKRAHVDETPFLVDLHLENVAGTNKRRRSMLPKNLSDLPSGASFTPTSNGEGSSSNLHTSPNSENGAGDSSLDDDLGPLERARRKRPNLFTMFHKD